MGKQTTRFLLLTLLQEVYSYFYFHLPAIQLFISTWENVLKTYHSPLHNSVITGDILITINNNNICPLPFCSFLTVLS